MSNLTVNNKDNWIAIKEQAQAVKDAGLLPANMTAAQAAIIVMKGQELGLGTMRALEGLYVVNGKIGMSANLVAGLIRERCPQAKLVVKRKDNKGCVIEVTRPGQETETFQFLEADAKAAGLLKPNSPWDKYAPNMYWSRTITQIGRQLFSDVLGAPYTPEELGGSHGSQEEIETKEVLHPPRPTVVVGISGSHANILQQDIKPAGMEAKNKEEVTPGTHESDLNSRFAPNGTSLSVTSKPLNSKPETVIVSTGEVVPYPPGPSFDEFEKLPDQQERPLKATTHWDRIATAGQHSGKPFIKILEEVGRDKFIKMHEAATNNIAKMGKEGKPIPETMSSTYGDLEKCIVELRDGV